MDILCPVYAWGTVDDMTTQYFRYTIKSNNFANRNSTSMSLNILFYSFFEHFVVYLVELHNLIQKGKTTNVTCPLFTLDDADLHTPCLLSEKVLNILWHLMALRQLRVAEAVKFILSPTACSPPVQK